MAFPTIGSLAYVKPEYFRSIGVADVTDPMPVYLERIGSSVNTRTWYVRNEHETLLCVEESFLAPRRGRPKKNVPRRP